MTTRLRRRDDGRIEVQAGKVELGQGLLDALAQIAADALAVPLERIVMRPADTASGVDEGMTSGSLSIQDAGRALREACRQARGDGLLGVRDGLGDEPVDGLSEGASERPSERPCEGPGGAVSVDDPAGASPLGQPLRRRDLPARFDGRPVFIHDLHLPGLVHGRVLHPPQPEARLLEADLAGAAAAGHGARVWRDGQLLGVLADRERDADAALAHLAATARWQRTRAWLDARLPMDALGAAQGAEVEHQRVAAHGGEPPAVPARTLRARYAKPWIAHASIAPSCALAQWDDEAGPQGFRLQVWSHSQGPFPLRRDLAIAFGLPEPAVRVRHVEGAGCYGHNGADDVAYDAAWLARQAGGRPVRVRWRREDELGRAPLGPAMAMRLEADLDHAGAVLHWRHAVWSPGHSSRPGRSASPALLGSWQTATPCAMPAAINVPLAAGGGAERNALPGYDLPAWSVDNHLVRAALPRSSALRALGAFGNVFALESFVDEIAHATGVDPLAWRRRHLGHDARARAVLDAVVHHAGGWPAAWREGIGHGLGLARYKGTGAWCAVWAEVEAAARLQVRRLVIAADVGLAVNPLGVAAQLEGGAWQATSWTLLEQVQFDADGITSDTWARYPILGFRDLPSIEVHLVPSAEPSLGAGEAALGPTAAAIANALFDALGVRVRELPLTPERIVAAMDAPSHDAPETP